RRLAGQDHPLRITRGPAVAEIAQLQVRLREELRQILMLEVGNPRSRRDPLRLVPRPQVGIKEVQPLLARHLRARRRLPEPPGSRPRHQPPPARPGGGSEAYPHRLMKPGRPVTVERAIETTLRQWDELVALLLLGGQRVQRLDQVLAVLDTAHPAGTSLEDQADAEWFHPCSTSRRYHAATTASPASSVTEGRK